MVDVEVVCRYPPHSKKFRAPRDDGDPDQVDKGKEMCQTNGWSIGKRGGERQMQTITSLTTQNQHTFVSMATVSEFSLAFAVSSSGLRSRASL